MEQWFKKQEPTFEPQWQHVSTRTDCVVGRAYGCGSTPEIYQLKPFLDLVVEKLSGGKIAALVEVLRIGTGEEQQRMVDRIADEALHAG